MQGLERPGSDATYGTLLTRCLGPQVEVLYFTWREALRGRYDVLHLHWPDQLLRDRSRLRTVLRRAAFLWLVEQARWRHIALVYTSHNLVPHESPDAVEARLLAWFRRRVTGQVRINPVTPALDVPVTRVILHGDYRAAYATLPRAAQVDGRVLTFGLIRRYKGVDELVRVFRATEVPGLTLRVVGRPAEPWWVTYLAEQTEADPRISATLDYVPDPVLVSEISAAQLVVLPHRAMHNSGTLLAALSLGRHVLAPDSPVNRTIRDEIGSRWLTLYGGELSPTTLQEGLVAARALDPGEQPTFAAERSWTVVGAEHVRLYRDVVSALHRGRQPARPRR